MFAWRYGSIPAQNTYQHGTGMEAHTMQDVVEFNADELESLSRDQARRKIKDGIKLKVRGIFNRLTAEAFDSLDRNFDQTGDFDTGFRRVGTHIANSRDAVDLGPGTSRGNELYGQPLLTASAIRDAMESIEGMMRVPEEMMPQFVGTASETPRDKAERKALKLLEEKIGERKYKTLMTIGHFDEKGKHGIYQFHLDNPHGVRHVQFIDAGGKKRPIIWDLCIQSSVHDMPKGDVILARYLEFIADEEKFRRTANWRNVRTADEAHEQFGSSG